MTDHAAYASDPVAPTTRPEADVDALEAMIDGLPDGLALLSTAGQILRVNEAAAALFGVPQTSLVGRSAADPDLDFTLEPAWLQEVLATRHAVSRTVDLPGGRKAMLSLRARTDDGGKPSYVVVVVRDVTAIGELVNRVNTTAPTAAAGWWDLRRNDVGLDRIVTDSRVMRTVAEKALRYSTVDSPVLIVGETGTGKSLFARIIHQASARAGAALREVNCGAIPAGLMESELFGYARGAFTGADAKGRTGLVELAHAGTLLLDEIGDMPVLLQVKLLKFLEAGEVWPVGAAKPKRVDVRVVAATNADLASMVAQGSFRRDLFYRLNVLMLEVPPLREHPEDIEPLVEMMSVALEPKVGRRMRLTREALDVLGRYAFPGNIRELWNIVERLAVSARSEVADVSELPGDVALSALAESASPAPTNLRKVLRKVEAGIVREALQRYGTQAKAAKHLGVGQATIARKARLLAEPVD
jgi:PAS domain S-box-containing protein